MLESLDTINIFLVLAGVANLLYGFVVYQRGQTTASNQTFFAFAFTVALWCFTMVAVRAASSNEVGYFWVRVLYIVAAFVPLTFLYFALAFESSRSFSRWFYFFVAIPAFVFTVCAYIPGFLILSIEKHAPLEPVINFNYVIHGLYLLYVVSYAVGVIAILFTRYLKSERVTKNRLAYILIGTSVPWGVSLTTNLFLPFFNIFDYNWLGQISTFFSTSIISYGIFRSRLFNVKVIATEILVFLLWVISFGQVIFSESDTQTVFNIGVFILLFIGGLFLTRSVYQEVESRERIEALAKDLSVANERLKELDQLKSEFVSVASHQLRSPLAAIKGYASLILEGSFGKISPGATEAVQRILDSGKGMAFMVEDFLNVSRIEQGKMEYNFTDTDVEKMVQLIVEDFLPAVKSANLRISFTTDNRPPYRSHIDSGKMRQVITNLIDNAVKYTPKGAITVQLLKMPAERLRISVSDTGVGIDPATIPALFEKFSRAKDANRTNVSGSGLGLYVAKTIVQAHRGRIWAESKGKGFGSTFIVDLISL